MKLNIWGNIFGSSGFAIHTRSLFNALADKGIDVRLQTQLPENWVRLVNDKELVGINKPMSRDRITVFIGHPQYLPLAHNDSDNVIPFVVWEGDSIPQYWRKHLEDERIKMIFVPSNHVTDAILNYYSKKEVDKYNYMFDKIAIIPHGVNTEFFPANKSESNRFVFVANKGWAKGNEDRGGIQHLLKAYHEEFTADDKVDLNVKINIAYCPPGWNFDQELKNIGIFRNEKSPLLRVSLDNAEYKEMHKFYTGDVFVSVAEAEGFNLPVLEAMSSGMPAIVSSFGGQTDFINENTGWLIDGEMHEVKNDIIYEGISWQKPNIDELKKTMRWCFTHKEECKLKGLEAQKISQQFTWKNTALKVIEEIKKII